MYKYLVIIAGVVLCSCQPSSKKVQEHSQNLLLDKFANLNRDSICVYSSRDNLNDWGDYQGQALDSIDISLLPEELKTQHVSGHDDFFACGKIKMGPGIYGLLIRTPSVYESSSIKFFIYDSANVSLNTHYELAEAWGDAGDSYSLRTWLFKDSNKGIKVLAHRNDSYDNSVEDERDTTIESYNAFYLTRITTKGVDTISKDSLSLVNQYKYFLKTSN